MRSTYKPQGGSPIVPKEGTAIWLVHPGVSKLVVAVVATGNSARSRGSYEACAHPITPTHTTG